MKGIKKMVFDLLCHHCKTLNEDIIIKNSRTGFPVSCENCGTKLDEKNKIIGTTIFKFKGFGFYHTDYKQFNGKEM